MISTIIITVTMLWPIPRLMVLSIRSNGKDFVREWMTCGMPQRL